MDKAIIEQKRGTKQNIAPDHAVMERFAAAIKNSQDPMWSNAPRGLL